MSPIESQPWNPDRSWADPFIALLCLAVLALVGLHLRAARIQVAAPDARVSFQGRITDAVLGGSRELAKLPLKPLQLPKAGLPGVEAAARSGWDQAVIAVHAAESGDLDLGALRAQAAPGPVGDSFRRAFAFAYRRAGAPPAPAALAEVATALGDGCAARTLEARVLAGSSGLPGGTEAGTRVAALERGAREWALTRLALLAAAGLGALLLAAAGLAFGLFLALQPHAPAVLPRFGLSGRAVLIVLLGWFLTFLSASSAVALILRAIPGLRPFQLPLVYGLHAWLGVAYLCRAEGIRFRTLLRRVAPAPRGAALATGLGYFALAFAAVLVVALVSSPLLGRGQSPQRQLFDLMASLHGALPVLLVFITVAGLAPAFEELLFRGFLLPWLSQRLGARFPNRGRLLAAGLTAVGFAAMHLQPLGLPTLTTLGLVLGFAFLRTGNLATSILVHALWNGGVFLLVRCI
jgi:membrane protease YdiL (CAAX protease family)